MTTATTGIITTSQYSVLRLIKQGFTLPEIVEETGFKFNTVRTAARNLQKKGIVQSNGRGVRMTTTVDLRTVRPR